MVIPSTSKQYLYLLPYQFLIGVTSVALDWRGAGGAGAFDAKGKETVDKGGPCKNLLGNYTDVGDKRCHFLLIV